MTATLPEVGHTLLATPDVYRPQEDSHLLVETMERATVVVGRRVVDLCTGSGVVAIAAAQLGAQSVSAWDISFDAVQCARHNAQAAEVDVTVRHGMFTEALEHGPYDVVVVNPPYVPNPTTVDLSFRSDTDPMWSWDGGDDGRRVIDPLCDIAADLLADGGSMLLVQSEFAGVDQTVNALCRSGLHTDIVARQSIPFGPVLTAQASWLEATGRLPVGHRCEELVVIRAYKQ
ncbi:MAG: HemK2/MTQ2 family protein methyltransferase [Mycobacterium sp.]